MEELVIEVERRSSTGKSASRKLRREGLIPAVVYGGGKESVPVVVDRRAVTELFRQKGGRHSVFLLKMKGTKQERNALLIDAQIDPLTGHYVHLDFIRVLKGQQVKVDVPILLDGEAPGVKQGGLLDFVQRVLHVECEAAKIPQSVVVDISPLEIGDHVTVGSLELPEGVKVLDDPSVVLVTIEAHGMKGVEEEEEEAEAAETAEEGAEPEVIRKGRGEAEEEAE